MTTESTRGKARRQPAGDARAARREPSDLPRDLLTGYAIARLARLVARNATRRVGDVLGLTLAEWRVLLVLEENGGDPLDEVARRALLEASHASVAATGLRRRGLIDRSIHPRDRRRVCLRRTPAGTRAVEQYLAETASERRALWGVLTATERQDLVQLLDRLVEAAVGLGYEDAAVRNRGRRRA